MTDDEFFALHPQPDLVVGLAYPTLIFPEDADEENTSIYAFPPKPEKYKRQYAVDLTGCPMNLMREFNKVIVDEEDDDLFDLPDLIPNEDLPENLTMEELAVEYEKILAKQYNLVEINKRNKIDEEERMQIKKDQEERMQIKKEKEERVQVKKDREERVQEVAKDRRERMQIMKDGEMRRFSILQDKEEQERVQAIKDRNTKCFRTLEKRKDDSFRF